MAFELCLRSTNDLDILAGTNQLSLACNFSVIEDRLGIWRGAPFQRAATASLQAQRVCIEVSDVNRRRVWDGHTGGFCSQKKICAQHNKDDQSLQELHVVNSKQTWGVHVLWHFATKTANIMSDEPACRPTQYETSDTCKKRQHILQFRSHINDDEYIPRGHLERHAFRAGRSRLLSYILGEQKDSIRLWRWFHCRIDVELGMKKSSWTAHVVKGSTKHVYRWP